MDSATTTGDIAPSTEVLDHAALEIPHPRPFTCRLAISRTQLSSVVDHVSNVEYLRWVDRVAELHADAMGYTRAELLRRGIMWFVARHEIDYQAEVFAGDELVAATWVRSIRRVKSWRDTVFHRPRDGTIVCRASTLWVLVTLETRRPLRIDDEMRHRFDALEDQRD